VIVPSHCAFPWVCLECRKNISANVRRRAALRWPFPRSISSPSNSIRSNCLIPVYGTHFQAICVTQNLFFIFPAPHTAQIASYITHFYKPCSSHIIPHISHPSSIPDPRSCTNANLDSPQKVDHLKNIKKNNQLTKKWSLPLCSSLPSCSVRLDPNTPNSMISYSFYSFLDSCLFCFPQDSLGCHDRVVRLKVSLDLSDPLRSPALQGV
jgi:hypothetical protein